MKIFSSGYNSVQSDLVCKGQTRLMTMCVQDRFLESKGLLLRTEHPECISLFPALLWSLETGHNRSFYTTNLENAVSWDIFFSWRAVLRHLPVRHWIWTNPWCRLARGKGVYIHRGRGQEKASGGSSAVRCLGVLSRIMLVPQHVGVKHSA